MLLRAILSAFIGTAMMTISSQTEMIIEEREASPTPGKAAQKFLSLFGFKITSEKTFNVLSTWTHWIYGTFWGIVFYFLILLNIDIFLTGLLYLLIVWVTAQIILPFMGVAKPAWQYGGKALVTDLFHHLVYAASTTAGWILIGESIS